jgi:hypothetical protein
MSTNLTVGNETFAFPESGETPGWGEVVHDWAEAATDKLSSLSGTYDIPITTSSISDNQSTAANVTGLLFNSTVTRSFIAEYVVYRETDTPTKIRENGIITGVYDGSTGWEYSIKHIGDAGMDFIVTAAGQVQYYSSNMVGASYSGEIKFKARTLDV